MILWTKFSRQQNVNQNAYQKNYLMEFYYQIEKNNIDKKLNDANNLQKRNKSG